MSVGYGIGAKVEVSDARLGFLYEVDCIGLRGGELLYDPPRWKSGRFSHEEFYLVAGESHFVGGELAKARGKNFNRDLQLFLGSGWFGKHGAPPGPQTLTQLEAIVGLGPAVRVGFNPGELADFLLGWLGVDLYGDDVGNHSEAERSDANDVRAPTVAAR